MAIDYEYFWLCAGAKRVCVCDRGHNLADFGGGGQMPGMPPGGSASNGKIGPHYTKY